MESNIGKIYHVGWGYSMTLNNFYKVIKETPKGAIVREIGSTILDGGGYQGYETANPNVDKTETDWNAPVEMIDGNEKHPLKFKDYKVIKTETGYKGTVGLSRTHHLEETKVGQKHSYNHMD